MRPNSSPRSASPTKEPVKATYQSRPTIADHVKETMSLLNRATYFQRVVYICNHIANGDKDFNAKLQQHYEDIISICKENLFGERLSGMFLLYDGSSIVMLEGSEDIIGMFFQNLEPLIGQLFTGSKVIYVMNNIYQLFFDKIVWRSAVPPVLMLNLMSLEIDDIMNHTNVVLKRMFKMCERVSKEIEEDDAPSTLVLLQSKYSNLMPMPARMNLIVNAKQNFNLQEYAAITRTINIYDDYGENVWPIPFDYTPKKIFRPNKYDVNLTFKDAKKR